MPLSAAQRGTIAQLLVGSAVSLGFILGVYVLVPVPIPALESAGDRVAFALSWEPVAALALVLGVLRVVRGRFMSAARLDGSPPEPADVRLEVDRRYLQNTLEQLVLAVIAHLALATQLSGDELRLIPILATWFLIARVAYLIGYQRDPLARGFGWAATWLPTLTVLLYAVVRVAL
jgi:uncharacterized MAPEG superfamily protein